jgi:hypothetical protein
MNESLFGHLAFNFSKSPEDLATEALCYSLGKSTAANTAMLNFLRQINPNFPESLNFSTQGVGDKGERPDLIGKNTQGVEIFLGEAKFWAGLTDNQPISYLERLKKETGSILLFITPQKRLATLWPEIVRRCQNANLDYAVQSKTTKYLRSARCEHFPNLALTSWRALLNLIQSALEAEGEIDTLSDISKLRGLCDRMDEDAFLPIQSPELASMGGTRVVQYCDLAYQLIGKLVDEELAVTQNLTASGTHARYGRYFLVGEYGCMIQFNAHWWSTYRETPLWMSIKKGPDSPWTFPEEAQAKLISLEMEEPSRLIKDGNALIVPLYLPTGKEKDKVMEEVLSQLRDIINKLGIEIGS